MLYVEGDDDISFWHLQFNRYISEKEYEIQKVDGKENLDPYINGILNGDMENIVVACDSDYTEFQEGQLSHICIVRTYGHSIENTMFCPVYVAKYLRKFTKTTTDYTQDIRSWFENFCNSANCLLPYEIKNAIDPTHCNPLPKILTDKYHELKVSNHDCNLDNEKIRKHISSFVDQYSADEIEDISCMINQCSKERRYIMQGHFIADAIMAYIREKAKNIKGRTVSLSNDALYAAFSECDYTCRPLCPDLEFLRRQILAVSDKFACTKIS